MCGGDGVSFEPILSDKMTRNVKLNEGCSHFIVSWTVNPTQIEVLSHDWAGIQYNPMIQGSKPDQASRTSPFSIRDAALSNSSSR